MKPILAILSIIILSACAAPGINPGSNGDALSVKPDHEVYVEVRLDKGVMSSARQVSEISNPESTLIFYFTESESGMLLDVTNLTSNNIRYNIEMVGFNGKLHKTCSWVSLPGLTTSQRWPHPIPELKITNFHSVVINGRIVINGNVSCL